jgi:hypothetical protein
MTQTYTTCTFRTKRIRLTHVPLYREGYLSFSKKHNTSIIFPFKAVGCYFIIMTENIDCYIKCPHPNCFNQPAVYWTYARCKTSKTSLSSIGDISCNAGCWTAFIQYVLFLCNQGHNNEENTYKEASDFLLALSSAISASKVTYTQDLKKRDTFIKNVTIGVTSRWKYT